MEEEKRKEQETEGSADEDLRGGGELAGNELPTHDHLRSPLLRPASRRVVFQSGHLDGFPRHRYSPLGRHEFDVLEDREREVLQRGTWGCGLNSSEGLFALRMRRWGDSL